jgi:hypothetical protein
MGNYKAFDMQNLHRLASLLIVGSFCFCSSLSAQAQSDAYRFQVTPYAFTTAVNGVVEQQGRRANVETAGMIYVDARFGRWRASLDNLNMNVNAGTTLGLLLASADVSVRAWIANPEAGYAIFSGEGKELDAKAGVRVWTLRNNPFFSQSIAAEFDRSARSAVDPVVGVQSSLDLPHGMFIFAKGDVGGFGAGARTDWQAFGGGGFKFNDTIVGSVGYRYLSINDRTNTSAFEVVLKGAIVAIGIRF